MNKINPKSHDALFKWLIAAFTEEFFAHYFPGITIGKYRFIDKEFISKYEALKESLKGDLFLLMEVETDGELRELAIQIEHQSEREDVSERMFEYLCYVWLLKKKPVWSMVIYTDEALWKKQVPEKYFNELDPDRLLLIHQWTDMYKKVPDETIDRIRKEVNMDVIETTISEHIFNQGINQGIHQGIHQGNTAMLSRLMAKKYHISPERLPVQLETLNNDELLELGDRILDWDSFEKVEQWIEQRKKSA